jgi:hypothetical protein
MYNRQNVSIRRSSGWNSKLIRVTVNQPYELSFYKNLWNFFYANDLLRI